MINGPSLSLNALLCTMYGVTATNTIKHCSPISGIGTFQKAKGALQFTADVSNFTGSTIIDGGICVFRERLAVRRYRKWRDRTARNYQATLIVDVAELFRRAFGLPPAKTSARFVNNVIQFQLVRYWSWL